VQKQLPIAKRNSNTTGMTPKKRAFEARLKSLVIENLQMAIEQFC
jgi:hypothetical protein